MKQTIEHGSKAFNNKNQNSLTLLKLFLTVLVFSITFNQKSIAQATGSNYKTAIGVKFYPTAVTLKTFVKNNIAFEAIGYFWEKGTRITGLYEYHNNLSDDGALKWYIGPGAHVGFYNEKFFNGGTTFGLDGVLGLDYKFPGIPVNVSVDWQPSFEFGDYAGFNGNWGGIGLRLAF
jgi:hypothetical protein